MNTLNLTANGKGQQLIKAYLENNASDILAGKINNGTPFEKDGKQLINKKDMDGFMKFACEEAKKQAEKGTTSACLGEDVIYGWAMHYFEEDSIVGKLYNLDGTEYKSPAPVKKTTQTQPTITKPVTPLKPKEPTLFDMIAASEKQEQKPAETVQSEPVITDVKEVKAETEPTIDQIADSLQAAINEKHNVEPKPPEPDFLAKYNEYQRRYPDRIIVMRVGDFYEVFGEKATLAANDLGLMLTGKRISDTERIPMCGFPHHAKDIYLNKLRKSRSAIVIDGDDVQKLDTFGIEDYLDGDIDDNYDDLTVAEMREFDGDIQEPDVVPKTVMTPEQKTETKYVLSKDDIVFEPAVRKRLQEILGDVLA